MVTASKCALCLAVPGQRAFAEAQYKLSPGAERHLRVAWAQGKRKGLLHKMEKSAMPAPEDKQGQMPGSADMQARQASQMGASVSPFASFKVCNSHPWC